MTEPLRLVVFDVDGTLVDSQHEIVAAMQHAFDGAGLEAPDAGTILSIVGLSLPIAVRRLAPGLAGDVHDRLASGYRAHFARASGAAPPPLYPGAAALLETLSNRPATLLGVATGKSRRGLSGLLDAHGLARHFITTQVADDHPSKPHPSMLHAAMRETGTAPGQGVIVGDTGFDIEMGRAAGMRTIGVAWGYHGRARLVASGADTVVEDMAGLSVALAEHEGASS